jgi:hypothetical protein
MPSDLLYSHDSLHAASHQASYPDLNALVEEIARNLGCTDLPYTTDGHCELILNGDRSLTIWHAEDRLSLLLIAELNVPPGIDEESVSRSALGYCLGAASINAPVIGRNEDGALVLIWSMPADGSEDLAAEGISFFLENFELAESILAGEEVGEKGIEQASGATEPAASNQAALQSVAEALGLEKIEFDEDGFGVFQLGNGNLVLLQHSPERGQVTVLAQVTTLSTDGEQGLYSQALEYNLLAARDREPVLGLDTERQGLFLITTVNVQDSGATLVEPLLELFMNRYAKCVGTVYDPDYEERLEDEAAAANVGAGLADDEVLQTGIRV